MKVIAVAQEPGLIHQAHEITEIRVTQDIQKTDGRKHHAFLLDIGSLHSSHLEKPGEEIVAGILEELACHHAPEESMNATNFYFSHNIMIMTN